MWLSLRLSLRALRGLAGGVAFHAVWGDRSPAVGEGERVSQCHAVWIAAFRYQEWGIMGAEMARCLK